MSKIYKTDNGKYRAEVPYKYQGKYKKAKKTFDKKAAAVLWVAETEKLKNENVDALGSPDVLFVDYFDDWVKTYKVGVLRDATLWNYRNTSQVLHRLAPGIKLKSMTRPVVQKLINQYGLEVATSTLQTFSVHITGALREAYADGIINRDPTVKIIVHGQTIEKKKNYLEADEYDALMKYLESQPWTKVNFYVYTALLSGARIGEIVALMTSDIDFKSHTIHIQRTQIKVLSGTPRPYLFGPTKTKSSDRIIQMPDRWFAALKQYRQENSNVNSDYIFGPKFLTAQTYSNNLTKILRAAGVNDNITPHGLRHSHASHLISAGVSLEYVSERLGHQNVYITQKIYVHFLNKDRVVQNDFAMKIL
ncbi:tyrosine-type recombinase/integrase [Weissella cibaria]|uniref:tyrosine-type recombinase/integrase n=1 Tax=Weissella cibaria TaxID=137591 RepID=UPI0034E8F95B